MFGSLLYGTSGRRILPPPSRNKIAIVSGFESSVPTSWTGLSGRKLSLNDSGIIATWTLAFRKGVYHRPRRQVDSFSDNDGFAGAKRRQEIQQTLETVRRGGSYLISILHISHPQSKHSPTLTQYRRVDLA